MLRAQGWGSGEEELRWGGLWEWGKRRGQAVSGSAAEALQRGHAGSRGTGGLGLQVSELVSQGDSGLVFDCRSLQVKCPEGAKWGAAPLPLSRASVQITVLQRAPQLMRILNRACGGGRRPSLGLGPGQFCQGHPSPSGGCPGIQGDSGPLAHLATLKQLSLGAGLSHTLTRKCVCVCVLVVCVCNVCVLVVAPACL